MRLAVLLILLLAAVPATFAQRPDARVRPPAITCPRDHLTSYTGVVLDYRRGADRTWLRIRTDWDTTEEVSISHPGSGDPSRWFLMHGKPFEPADWNQIEERSGRLRAGMRAAAWVCDNGRNPVVDWDPPREP